jgi:hypothetical protein
MKKALLILFLLIFSASFVTVGFAAEKKAPKTKTYAGQVISMEANMLVVKGKKGEMSFDVTGAKMSGYKLMDEVKAGDKITVKYRKKEGKTMATLVRKAAVKTSKKSPKM